MIYAIDAYTYRLYMIGINMFECCLGACGRVRQKDVLVQKSSLTALIRRRFVVSEPTAPSVFHKHRFNQRHWWRILDHVRLPGRWCVWRSPTWHSAGVLSIAQAWVEHGAPRREFSDHKALKKILQKPSGPRHFGMNSDQMRRGLNETCDSLLVESLKGAFPRTGSVF